MTVSRPSAPDSPVWTKSSQLDIGMGEITDVVAVAATQEAVATIHKPTRGFGVAIRLVGWPAGTYTSLRPTRRGSSRHFEFAVSVEDESTPGPDQDDAARLAAPVPPPPKRRRTFSIRPTEPAAGGMLATLRSLIVRRLSLRSQLTPQSTSESGFSIHDSDDVMLLSYTDASSIMSTDTSGTIAINDEAARRAGSDVPLELLVTIALAVVDVTVDAEAYAAAQLDLRE